jgi:hypothetical protein
LASGIHKSDKKFSNEGFIFADNNIKFIGKIVVLKVAFFFRLASQEMAILVFAISSCWNFGVLFVSAVFRSEVHETTTSFQS